MAEDLTFPDPSGLVAQLRALHLDMLATARMYRDIADRGPLVDAKTAYRANAQSVEALAGRLDALIASSQTTAATGAPQCPMCAGKGWCSPEDAERGIQENGKVYAAGYELGKKVALSTGGSSSPEKHAPNCAREVMRHADDSAAYLSERCTCSASPAHDPDGWQQKEAALRSLTQEMLEFWPTTDPNLPMPYASLWSAYTLKVKEWADRIAAIIPAPSSGDRVRTD